ncbi:unnamed protein product [Phaeothamnion confervicola]
MEYAPFTAAFTSDSALSLSVSPGDGRRLRRLQRRRHAADGDLCADAVRRGAAWAAGDRDGGSLLEL